MDKLDIKVIFKQNEVEGEGILFNVKLKSSKVGMILRYLAL